MRVLWNTPNRLIIRHCPLRNWICSFSGLLLLFGILLLIHFLFQSLFPPVPGQFTADLRNEFWRGYWTAGMKSMEVSEARKISFCLLVWMVLSPCIANIWIYEARTVVWDFNATSEKLIVRHLLLWVERYEEHSFDTIKEIQASEKFGIRILLLNEKELQLCLDYSTSRNAASREVEQIASFLNIQQKDGRWQNKEGIELEEVRSAPPSNALRKFVSDGELQIFSFPVKTIENVQTVIVNEGILGIGYKQEERATLRSQQGKARQFAEDLGNGIQLEIVEIPSGGFPMGSAEYDRDCQNDERPKHWVNLSSFLLGKYPVTQEQWEAIAGYNPSHFTGRRRPVENISWYSAMDFCRNLSEKTGREYRLPSEAEWEYACRAGTTTPFHFGATITTDVANYVGNATTYTKRARSFFSGEGTSVVGSFPPNAFGLYDMHGNVWEWCADSWHDNYRGAPNDGSAWIDEKLNKYVRRGGSWHDLRRNCRSAYRSLSSPDNRLTTYGFRVTCSLPKTLL